MSQSETFKITFAKTMGHEGGYSNDPDDAGAETIFGISRRFHPDWLGWLHVDGLKNEHGEIEGISPNSPLRGFVADFYAANFWGRFQGDAVAAKNPDVAGEMFDTAVNMGVTRAVMFLQKALNYLNRNQLIFVDLVEDGLMGPASLQALTQIEGLVESNLLLKIMNVLQGNHYLEYMSKSPRQEKFARGWLKRVSL